jgi:hypothetical protein
MNPILGWAMALVALAAGWRGYGLPGIALAVSVIVFWLLIQFNRSVNVMRNAAGSPIGYIDSAVMLNAKLRKGLPMIQVVTLTKSLGRRIAEDPEPPQRSASATAQRRWLGLAPFRHNCAGASVRRETWSWADASGSDVTLVFAKGRCTSWTLNRPET